MVLKKALNSSNKIPHSLEKLYRLTGVKTYVYGPIKWIIAIVGQEEQEFTEI